jgi:diguanylate cyclase (GGDEF)-like protein/PAS domain S-box-containing protein
MGRDTHVARILLVEDDESFSMLVRAYLRAMAADAQPPLATLTRYAGVPKLDWVSTLAAARERLAARHYDLVLLDLHLPDSRGLETLRALRSSGERIIIVMTADDDPELPAKALDHGAYDFVAKGSMDRGGLRNIVRLATLQAAAMSSLRQSEARFRGLTQLIADVYWEQDAALRFTAFGRKNALHDRGFGGDSLLGMRLWDIDYVNMCAADWTRQKEAMQAQRPFNDLELCRIVEGRQLWMSMSGTPVFDEAGQFRGYRGIGQDITARKRAEQLRVLEQAVTGALAVAESPSSALGSVIRAICETEHWACGRFFGVDEAAGVLRCVETWGPPDPAIETFLARSRSRVYRRGEGLSGHVWQSGRAVWLADVSRDPRASGTAAGTGLAGGSFIFPVIAEGRTVGVLSFTSKEVRMPDERLMEAIGLIGAQVGQVLKRIATEIALRESEGRFRQTFDLAASGIAHIGLDGVFLRVNPRLCEMLGYREEELIGRSVREISHPEDHEAAERARGDLQVPSMRFEKRYLRKDGSIVWASLSVALARGAAGEPLYEISVVEDITSRKQNEERRAANERYQKKIARLGEEALAKRNAEELIAEAVRSVLEGLGGGTVAYLERAPHAHEVLVRRVAGMAAEEPCAPAVYATGSALAEALEQGRGARGELPFAWACGEIAELAAVQGEDGARGALCALPAGTAILGHDEAGFLAAAASVLSAGLKRIESESRLAFLAQFDPLTGLPNRALLADRFEQMIVQARRHQAQLGVLFVDLDEFKLVNDSLGHAGGDELLKEAARRLQAVVRAGDTVARIAGDEFAIVLADLGRAEDAALVAQKLIERLSAAVEVGGHEIFVSASIGVALFPADGEDVETLLGAADAAMYRAKQAGRNSFQFFTAEINQRTRARALLGAELRRALERGEFRLVYQPKFDLKTERPSGAEALLRWHHPTRGIVSPAHFIPTLEESGLIVPVGEWVLRQACADLRAWQAAGAELLPVAVNLSARQFRQLDLAARIRAIVTEADVRPELLELEITESQLMQDPDHAVRAMRSLADAGIRIAIDDFGTGYSSLAYLTRFPLAALKIDRSFVAGIVHQGGDATIVRTIIEMAHTLGFAVIAEGVENEGQKHFLRGLGCEQAQGFLFSRPISAQAMGELLGGKSSRARHLQRV